MVRYGLNQGKGLNQKETVLLKGDHLAKPLIFEIYKEIIKLGGNVLLDIVPDSVECNFSACFYEYASEDQLKFFPQKYSQGLISDIDHQIYVFAPTSMDLLSGSDSKKIMMHKEFFKKPWMEMRDEQERLGKFSWTLCNYGTPAMAEAANLSLEEYWEQIIEACYLREVDPVEKWKSLQKQIQENVIKLDNMNIESLHVSGEDVDLTIGLSPFSKWKGGSGANIPSFEIFTSPDWRKTNGWIKFNQPLYRYGNIIRDIYLEFKDGCVVRATASENQQLLLDMIATKNADKIGEFSLTDSRFSNITKPMADTLYDENIGGEFGNTHIALGNAYRDCYKGDAAKNTESDWENLGYNKSAIHTDIISTTNRTVTVVTADGEKKVIYQNGKFNL